MPRRSRIDAPGTLHHVICRGLERRKIFADDSDRDWFLERLGQILTETHTACFAWALIPNHFHLLLRTGKIPLATVMRRLLTGYAIYFNRRHHRSGHLFQNRYKSILCQEDAYLLELVRYIHLNPLRAGLIPDLIKLHKYPYSGHCALMGKKKHSWQDTQYVLGQFSTTLSTARRRYNTFVKQGQSQGQRKELTGGGLLRSNGGWESIKALRKVGIFSKGDDRILGNDEFVRQVLGQTNSELNRRYQIKAMGLDFDDVVQRVAEVLGVEVTAVLQKDRRKSTVTARSLLCFWAVRELGMSQAAVARKLGITAVGVGKAVMRGQGIAADGGYRLILE